MFGFKTRKSKPVVSERELQLERDLENAHRAIRRAERLIWQLPDSVDYKVTWLYHYGSGFCLRD